MREGFSLSSARWGVNNAEVDNRGYFTVYSNIYVWGAKDWYHWGS
jgi:hypothetical protein